MIDLRDYGRLLGYPPGKALEGDVLARAEAAIDWYRALGRPRVYVQETDGEAIAAVTAGSEVEDEIAKRWAEDRVDEAYFLDRLAAAIVEKLASQIGPHRCPGYEGFPLDDQRRLYEVLAPLAPEIELLPSGMLKPVHSLLGVFTLGAVDDENPCTRCGLPRCRFRRKAA